MESKRFQAFVNERRSVDFEDTDAVHGFMQLMIPVGGDPVLYDVNEWLRASRRIRVYLPRVLEREPRKIETRYLLPMLAAIRAFDYAMSALSESEEISIEVHVRPKGLLQNDSEKNEALAIEKEE